MEAPLVSSTKMSPRALGLAAVVLLCGLVVLQMFVSPLIAFAVFAGGLFIVLTFVRPLGVLAFLALYLPFEPFLLQFVPNVVYAFVRYLPEGLIYLLCAVVAWRLWRKKKRLHVTPITAGFVLFLILLLASILINVVNPTVAILGVRQIIRFMLLFFIAVELQPSERYVKRLTLALFGVLLFESVLGIVQRFSGGALDPYLLPANAHTLADLTLTSGVDQFWDPGSRAFATFGRYDVFGNFLAFFLALASGLLYEPLMRKDWRILWWVFALGLPALVLTFSRASWFGFLIGFLFIALILYRDTRVAAGFAAFVIVAFGYVAVTGLNVSTITEESGQTLIERFYETFSIARWQGEYYGLGRVYWIVQTPLVVVRSSPLFGVGPGQFGGGAVAALGNMTVYEKLGLPFGVFGTDGSIDNNWFALWGETGTLGLVVYLWIYAQLMKMGEQARTSNASHFVRALGAGYTAALLGGLLIAFLSTALEIRTYAFYVWLYGGFVYGLTKNAGRKDGGNAGREDAGRVDGNAK